MFGSTMIEVLIGLFLLYIVLSMMASAVNEVISNKLDKRAKDLQKFIENLFDDAKKSGQGAEMINKFYSSLFVNTQLGKKSQLPSYIKGEEFSQALFDLAALTSDGETNFKALREQIKQLMPDNSALKQVFLNAIDRTDGARVNVSAYLAKWFDDQMNHLRTQYKKWTNYVLLIIGLVISVVLNVDTIRVTDALLTNPAQRQAIVEEAKNIQLGAGAENSLGDLQKQLDSLALPIGWPEESAPAVSAPNFFLWLIKKVIGILVTAFAVSQGAPFWFDLLNKITNLRATNRPPDEEARQLANPPQKISPQSSNLTDSTIVSNP